jgi:protoporphyrinogen oxidase
MNHDLVIIGGGPAGLAAAYEAVGHGASVAVVEKLDQLGGLSRTLEFAGNRFDIGPHRFHTRNTEVGDLFATVLGDDLLRVPRQTRILHGTTFFNYPLTPLNAMFGLGAGRAMGIAASYAAARLRARTAPREIETFEDWIIDRFGRRLHETFFRSYTEKVWGISCREIGADWAAQRIRGLNLSVALKNALFKRRPAPVKTLIDEFNYPRLGAGQAYEKMGAIVRAKGGAVVTGTAVRSLCREGMRVLAVTAEDGGGTIEMRGRFFLASAPLTEIVEMMEPEAPPEVLAACRALRYRDHICVNLLVEGNPFPDNWTYLHSADVRAARVANYRNFSLAMATPGVSPLTVEYFAFAGDADWTTSDESLIALATRELALMKLVEPDQVRGGFVVRNRKVYPVIAIGHERPLAVIKQWLDRFENLLPIGRSGMFKYNNQDHAMATGLLAARTALGLGRFDPWLVNVDGEYHEGGEAR